MSTRLGSYDSDTFNPLPRVNGDIWFRSDLNEVRGYLNGQVVGLFDLDGYPKQIKTRHLRITKNKTDFAINALTKQITLVSLPPNGEVISVTAECTQVWNGGATVTMSAGRAQTPTDFLIAQDVKTTGFKDTLGTVLTTKRGMFSSTQPTDIVAEATSTVSNLDQSTTGSITFYVTYIAY